MTKQAEKLDVVKATLKKNHRHGGKEYREGDEVELTKAQAERLIRREVI